MVGGVCGIYAAVAHSVVFVDWGDSSESGMTAEIAQGMVEWS